MTTTEPYAQLQYRPIHGCQMAYIDEGQGDAIVFQHGQPTSSYVWRNVLPHIEGLGRLVACDLIGMGGSENLDPVLGPERYSLASHREYLFALWHELNLGDRVVLVLDDWGAALGFDWARKNPERVRGIVYMEPMAIPLQWSDLPPLAHPFFRALRSPVGETMVLEENIFIERILPGAVIRQLSTEELAHYRRPFADRGEDRRPTLSWPRSLPLDGDPAATVEFMNGYAQWMAESDVPKLFITGDPGQVVTGRVREVYRTWRNQSELTVQGRKLLQEDSPDAIGSAIAAFIRRLNASASAPGGHV